MTVYVLVMDSVFDYEPEQQVMVFQTKSQAQEAMWNDTQCAKEHGLTDNMVCDYEGDMNICYCEKGDYTRNHLEWTIYEREVEPDKELQQ